MIDSLQLISWNWNESWKSNLQFLERDSFAIDPKDCRYEEHFTGIVNRIFLLVETDKVNFHVEKVG